MGLDRDSMRSFKIVLDAFARLSANTLTASLAGLRSPVRVNLGEAAQRPWSDIVENLAPFMCVVQIKLHPLDDQAMLFMPFELASALFELRMGAGGVAEIPPRSLTEIELQVLSPLFEATLSELENALSPIVAVKVEVLRTASGSGVIGLEKSRGTWLVADFSVKLTEDRSYQFSLCIPVSTLRSVAESMAESRARSRPEEVETQKALEHVLALPMSVAVQFAPVTLSAHDLAGIQIGDVIPLHHGTGRPMDLIVGEMPYLKVVPSAARHRLEVTVIDGAGSYRHTGALGPGSREQVQVG